MSTELYSYGMVHGWTELHNKLETLDTGRLFSELDDTIQMDILNVSNEEWAFMRSKKFVYMAICKELLKRVKDEP